MYWLKYDSGWYSSSSCTSSSKITALPSTPTRTGYEFLGYNTESNGSGATAVSATGSINLSDTYYSTDGTRTWYAVWEARNSHPNPLPCRWFSICAHWAKPRKIENWFRVWKQGLRGCLRQGSYLSFWARSKATPAKNLVVEQLTQTLKLPLWIC